MAVRELMLHVEVRRAVLILPSSMRRGTNHLRVVESTLGLRWG